MKGRFAFGVVVTALNLAFAPPASAWWNQNWTKRVKLTFLNSGQAENLTSFPVLVRLDSSRLNYADTQNAGQDIRFVDADDTTPLAYEIETWSESGSSYVWVKVPQIDASSTTDFIWMYYGNATIGDGQDASNTWEPNYRGVWHLKEDPVVAGPGGMIDSSGTGNHGTDEVNPVQTPGQINGSLSFDGTLDRDVLIPDNASLQLATNMTISGWARTTSADGSARLIVAKWKALNSNYWLGKLDATSMAFGIDGGPNANCLLTFVNDGAWHHVVGVADASAGQIRIYVDGVERGNNPSYDGASETGTSEVRIGRSPGATLQDWNGGIDEVRVEAVARSAAWLRAQHLSMRDYFISYGTPGPSGVMQLKSGSYSGDGIDNRPIYVGFQPDVVIVDMDEIVDLAPNEAVVRTSTMAGDASKAIDEALVIAPDQIQSLDPTGFTVGTNARVNQAGRTYRWVAFQAAAGKLKVGTYGGDGVTDNRSIGGVGFEPEYVIVIPESSAQAVQRSSAMPGDLTHNFKADGFADMIQALEVNGFQVGLDPYVNAVGVTYHYAAWNAAPGEFAVGVYTGDGVTDNRNINGAGFFPEYVIVKRSWGVPGDALNASTHKMGSMGVGTDRSLLMKSRLGEPDNIQALQSDGFQVGLHNRVNAGAAPNTYYWMAFGPHRPQINYRSIGTAPNVLGTLNATQGSVLVTDATASWQTANRGRGDRIRIDVTDYVVASVISETQLQLTEPFAASSGSYAYTIARQFGLLTTWEDCIDGGPCAFFPVGSSSLVNDDRNEVGIVYDDGASFLGGLLIDGSVTDATHTITLTADGDNRHYGIPGGGVVIDNSLNAPAIHLADDYATVEWMEIQNGGGGSAFGIYINGIAPAGASRINLRNNLIHDLPTWGIGLDDTDLVIDVYNNIIYSCNIAIRISQDLQTWSQIRLFNNTLYNNVTYGVNSSTNVNPQQITLRNNLVALSGTDYTLNFAPNASSSHNLSTDTTADDPTVSPGGGALISQNIDTAVRFVNRAAFDLHLQGASTAVNQGADLGGVFAFDLDGSARVTPWDIGADDVLATTEVELASFEATGANGAVELTWETGSELDNLGFHLHRATTESGPYVRVTAGVIPGLGSSPVGARYHYIDSEVVNDTPYFYKLEDIETSGRSTLHGPVSAIPSSEAPSPPSAGSSLITYGNPQANAFRVLRRSPQGLVLELLTEGFYAEPQEDGTVRIEIPGFQPRSELGIPVLRPWVDAIAERGVSLSSVHPSLVQSFTGLRPSGAEAAEIIATRKGIVRAGRGARRALLDRQGFFPKELARLLQVGFQGESKKAQLELAPLRWNGSAQELVVARRLEVHLVFSGRVADGRGRRGRETNVLAQLVTIDQGLYALRYEELFAKGRGRALEQIVLSRQGKSVPFHIEPAGRRFGPGSRLYFLSEGADANPYGHEAVYELEAGSGGALMGLGTASPSGEERSWYLETDDYGENRLYQAGLLEAPDLWLWDMLLAPVSKSFAFQLRGLRAESSRLTLWLQGVSDSDAEPDHHVRVYVNEAFQEEISWDGKESRKIELTLLPDALHEGENVVSIENVGDTEAPYSMVMLDRFQVVYPRSASAEGGVLEGLWASSGTALVRELQDSLLLDITEQAPRWLSGAQLDADGGFRFRAEAGRSYLALSRDAVRRPSIRQLSRPTLKKESLQADYLVIAPKAFSSAAAPLLTHRSGEGLRVKFASLEDVYNEFGHGETSPEAIREFLSFAYHHWKEPKLRYVLLLGDATYDFKDYLRTGVMNQLPPLMVKTSYLWTVSDPTLAAVHGDDLLPDVAIGRLPAGNADELRSMVSKILAYESGEAGRESLVVLVNDDSDQAGDFAANADEIARGVLAGKTVRRLSLNELGGAMRSEILRAFDEGASLVSYMGHGGIHLWADENVLNVSDVPSLSAQAQQPILLTMNCLNGYFHFPFFDALSEELLKAEGKGAIAAFSPSGLSLNHPAHLFHLALLDALFHQPHPRLGDAVLDAQERYAESGAFPELLSIYHLLGDPALKLR